MDQCYPEYIIKFLNLGSSFPYTRGRNFPNAPPPLTSLLQTTQPGYSQGKSAHFKAYNPRPPAKPGNSQGTSPHPNKYNSNLNSSTRHAASTSNIQNLSRSATPITPTETGDSQETSPHPYKYNSNLVSSRRFAASTSNIQSLSRSATPMTPTETGDSQGISRSGASVQNLFSNEDFSNSTQNHQRINEKESLCLIQ